MLQRGAAALEKIFGLLDVGETVPTGGEPVDEVRGHLVLRDVWFRYRPDGGGRAPWHRPRGAAR